MKTLRPLALATVVSVLELVALGSARARTVYTPCDPGRYMVLGEPLIIDVGSPIETDGINYGEQIAVDSGCALETPLRLKATKNGTRFKVKWLACEGIFGKVSMSGRIETTCQTMTGVFKAKKAKVRRSYTATKSFCGDEIYDPFLEDCEGASGCVGGVCLPDCTCVGGVTTTSTTIGGTSSTLGTSSTSTSTSSTTSTTTNARPDLVPTAFTPSATTIVSGQQATVSWTVENQGQASAGAGWYDLVTLSTDQFPSGNDTVLIQSYHNSALAVGTNYSMNGQLITIPTTQAAGTYYLLFQTDGYAGITESDDTNNLATPVEITVQTPDLVPTAFMAASTTIVSGQQTTVSWTVENQGTGTAIGGWYDVVLLSADQFPSGNDTLLIQNYRSSQNVGAGASYSTNGQLITIPATQAEGTYYLLFSTDYYAGLFENGQDANNVWPTPIELTIQTPDLVPTDFMAASTTIVSGQQTTVSWTVENQGSGAAIGAWYDVVLLSADQSPSANDTVLVQNYRSSQNVGAGTSYSTNGQLITIPGTQAAGTYYLLFSTDYYVSLFENGQDTNNTWSMPIELTIQTPDLVPTDFMAASTTIVSGQQTTVSWTVENQGSGTAIGAWYDVVLLSADQFPSANDTVLVQNYRSSQNVGAGTSYSTNGQLITIPGTQAAGTYYLLFSTDYYVSLFENGQDANNVWPTPIELTIQTPDLVPTDFMAASTTIVSGQQTTVSWTVENQGSGTAIGAWYDVVLLSADQFPSANDTVLVQNYRSSQNVGAGTSYSTNGQLITIPATQAEGTYYLLFATDYYAGLFENGQDANNAWPTPIQITVQTPDLVPTAFIPASTTIPAGGASTVSWTVENQGSGTAIGAWYDVVLLSTDQFPSANDAVLVQNYRSSQNLAAGVNYSVNGQAISIAAAVTPGTYFLLFATDYYAGLFENGEDANNLFTAVQITVN